MSEPDIAPTVAQGENKPASSSWKRPLTYEELTDVIDLSLFAGQMLLQHGANSRRTEESVHRIGTDIGCDWLDVLVATDEIEVTAISGDQFRTKIRRIVRIGVNLWMVTAVNDLSRRIDMGEVDRHEARRILNEIANTPSQFNRWVVVIMVGLACAAFNRLFGGDWLAFGLTFLGAAVAMFVRQELSRRHFNQFLVVFICALVAGIITGIGIRAGFTHEPESALVAAVLLLVPGVPLINSTQDLIHGHITTGIARGIVGLIISLAIALGLLLAFAITGVSGI